RPPPRRKSRLLPRLPSRRRSPLSHCGGCCSDHCSAVVLEAPKRDMGLMDRLALSLLYTLPPETAHHAALYALEHHLVSSRAEPDDPLLRTRVWDLEFPNPVGLAAGFDKDARVADAMLSLGFGFVECGTVTSAPQPGNPKPRLFRLDHDHAVINRLGFNSDGVDGFAR